VSAKRDWVIPHTMHFDPSKGQRLSLSQTLSCLAIDRESDDDRVQ